MGDGGFWGVSWGGNPSDHQELFELCFTCTTSDFLRFMNHLVKMEYFSGAKVEFQLQEDLVGSP